MSGLPTSAVALLAACLITGPVAAQPPPAHLSFFADEVDARILLDWLNADPNLAFVVADGPRAPKLTPEMLLKLVPKKLPPGWERKAPKGVSSSAVPTRGIASAGARCAAYRA